MSFFASLSAHKGLVALAAVAVVVALVMTFSVAKKVSPLSWMLYGPVNTSSGVAIGGYDPVAYLDGQAVSGRSEHSVEHDGATWLFSSRENAMRFADDPASLSPEYGGFCSFAVTKGFTAGADPTVFHRANGRTFLFADASMRANWLADREKAVMTGDEKWAAVK